MFPSVNQEQMAKVQQFSQFIVAQIRVDYKESVILIGLATDHPEAKKIVNDLLHQFPELLATQLSAIFAIQGEIVEVNKGDEEQVQPS